MTTSSSKTSTSSKKPAGEKLQKILARGGFGSRREVEKIIAQGVVKVNGKVATLGDRAFPTDTIKVNDQLVKETRLEKQPTQVILYNKPEGLVCSRKDEKDRETIFSSLPRIINSRWISVGRLDINTSGLLILTNNGELANRLMHPSYEMEREYSVRVFGEVSDEILNRLKKGVKLEDGFAKFESIGKIPQQEEESINQWYRVVIKEGRNREVRRIWESQGVQVSRLVRTRYGQFSLPRTLRRGKSEPLTWKQINQLLKSVDLAEEPRPDLRNNPTKAKKMAAKHAEPFKKETGRGKYKEKGENHREEKPKTKSSRRR
ncbi:pseudouridine synthase [Hydrogenovibrio sp. 3SP14C1]|uniref:23S rRNA pseudouridine(2605) synthase RluB n=1 Tax=Hydrogenovibrio sp. 3SP14C1 TaxID=3038774 RepID=UPI0024173DE9|nr:pseudouridine synthase [Hydrogenovibrio sp. 3SP14C1]MDG4812789.1 pseudouridine synthase [Hydrogenovibrio sp. 3SP14C1]